MGYVAVDHMAHKEISKIRDKIKTPKYIIKKILRLMSVDAESFCESHDWPYLWSGQQSENYR